jgi:hypothetical protein
MLLLEKFASKGKWLYFILVFPLFFLIGMEVDFSIFVTGVLGFIIFWRGISLFNDITGHSETLFLFLTFLLGIIVIIYSAFLHYPHQNLIVALIIFEILLILVGKFFNKWNTITEDKLRFILYFIKIIGGVSFIGVVASFSLKYLQSIFFGTLKNAAMMGAYAGIPILKISEWILRQFGSGKRTTHLLDSDVQKEVDQYELHTLTTPNLRYVFLIVAVMILFFYIYKKRVKFLAVNDQSSSVEIFGGSVKNERKSIFKKQNKPPEDFIRREIFQLEKYAFKVKLGRLPFETLDEWWERIGLTDTNHVNEMYEKVRYGAILASKEEQVQIKEEILHLKQQIKDIAKSEKN